MCKIYLTFLLMTMLLTAGYCQDTDQKKLFVRSVHYSFKAYKDTEIKLNVNELKLYQLIMEYRASHGKASIPLSKALTFVGQTHAGDLTEHYSVNGKCNLHSWSKKGIWSPCCYSGDHSQAECMWNKPRELTPYTGDGFELAYWHLWTPTPENTLEHWKQSPLHDPVILNTGKWEEVSWQAIGIAMYDDYALVWLGKIQDPEGPPTLPDTTP
jgi:hypothetical protein